MEYGNNIAKVVTHVLSAGSPADYFFFFSSRRRHTMSLCDWSSDVCSSDLSHGGQLLVRRLFLVEVLLQQGRAIVAAEFLRPGDQAAIAGDLVVFDRLRRGNEGRIEHR